MDFDILPLNCLVTNVLLSDLDLIFVKKKSNANISKTESSCPKIQNFVRPSVHPSRPSVRRVRSTVRTFVQPAVHRSFRPSVRSVRPSGCPSVRRVRPSVCPTSVRPFVAFVCPSCSSVHLIQHSVRPSDRPSIRPSVPSSVCPYVRASGRGHPFVSLIHPSVRARPAKEF